VKLRVRGHRWPFIIDMQGYIADEARFERLPNRPNPICCG